MRAKTVTVHDKMQRNYRYHLTEPSGRNFDPDFKPQLTPKEMLELGIFGGKYMTDCQKEFPKSWFADAKPSPKGGLTDILYQRDGDYSIAVVPSRWDGGGAKVCGAGGRYRSDECGLTVL